MKSGLTDKEILALKAILFLAINSKKAVNGGTYVEHIKSHKTEMIKFSEAFDIVENMAYDKSEEGIEI
jgi:hypothetical protein